MAAKGKASGFHVNFHVKEGDATPYLDEQILKRDKK